MYRTTLTNEQRDELNRRAHQAGISARVRDRLEMVRLSDAGWSVPRIGRHLSQHEQTVRLWIKAFQSGSFDALVGKPYPGKQSALTPAILEAVRAELAKADRTWSAQQITDWVGEHQGVALSVGRMRKHLKRARLSWKRTSRSLAHKQKPEEVAEKAAILQILEKGAMPD